MIFKYYIAAFFAFLYVSVFAQPLLAPVKVRKIPGQFVSFTVDNLDNIYLLNASNQLKKITATGDSVAVYNHLKRFGEITQIDVSNPLKILLYYKNFATIAILDGVLSLKGTIDLRKKNLPLVSAIGLSYDNKIWLYDELDNMLKKVDDQGNTILKTADFRQLFTTATTPQFILDRNKYVFLYDPQSGIYTFDYYGALKNKIVITGWENLNIGASYIWGNNARNYFRYSFASFRYDEWPLLPEFEGCKQFFFKEQFLYALNQEGLMIYSIR